MRSGSRVAASFKGLRPASRRASKAARGASKKSDTEPELLLRRALWRTGCRYRKNVRTLPGCPDIVFAGSRLVVFCDGDFWHGRGWAARKKKLAEGHNASYWIAKIERSMERDLQSVALLQGAGWRVVRIWESEIKADLHAVVARIRHLLGQRAVAEGEGS